MKGKVTKKELRKELKTAIVGVGAFIIYYSMRNWILETFPLWIQFLIGGGLIYFALKKW